MPRDAGHHFDDPELAPWFHRITRASKSGSLLSGIERQTWPDTSTQLAPGHYILLDFAWPKKRHVPDYLLFSEQAFNLFNTVDVTVFCDLTVS